MALTTDQMNQLLYDAMDGKATPSIAGDEAAAYFVTIKKQVADLKAKGVMPMPIPD